MADVVAEQVGSTAVVTENAVGGAGPEGQVLAEAGRVVHPASAPADGTTGDAPGSASGAKGGAPEVDDDSWKSALPDADRRRIDRMITASGQKNAERLRELETHVGRLSWADDLNRLVSSENPQDRQRAVALLKATLSTVEQYTPQAAQDPLAGVDLQALEAIAPGAGKALQSIITRNAQLEERIGQTHSVAERAAERTAQRELEAEATQLESWAKANNLPFDLDKIVATEDRLGIADLRAAYYATYGDALIESGRKASNAALERRKAASLPGGSSNATAPSRPKFTSMQDQWEWLKRERGLTGPIEFGKG